VIVEVAQEACGTSQDFSAFAGVLAASSDLQPTQSAITVEDPRQSETEAASERGVQGYRLTSRGYNRTLDRNPIDQFVGLFVKSPCSRRKQD
jgi:hypothetical protein